MFDVQDYKLTYPKLLMHGYWANYKRILFFDQNFWVPIQNVLEGEMAPPFKPENKIFEYFVFILYSDVCSMILNVKLTTHIVSKKLPSTRIQEY